MSKKIIFSLFLLMITMNVNAKEKLMDLLTIWEGPYQNTSIYKFADWSEGVACYVLAPKMVQNSITLNGLVYEANNVGSISCVKVTNGQAQPPRPNK